MRFVMGVVQEGPSRVITGVFMAGLHPPEYKTRVENAPQMRAGWTDDPDVMFEVAKEAAEEWRVVKQADKHSQGAVPR